MQKGFVLLNCDLGAEEQIVQKMLQMDKVKSAYLTFGAYDVIAEINAPDQESFEKNVADIRSLASVVSTMTLNIVES